MARVTNSKRVHGNLLRPAVGSSSTRESRIEVAAWVDICLLTCRVFGDFVRDWFVGGYSAKPTSNIPSSEWITYTLHNDHVYKNLKIPHVIKHLVLLDKDHSPFTMDLIKSNTICFYIA